MDAAELKDDDLHEKRMARFARERQEKADMRAEIERLRNALRIAKECIEGHFDDECSTCREAAATIDAALANAS